VISILGSKVVAGRGLVRPYAGRVLITSTGLDGNQVVSTIKQRVDVVTMVLMASDNLLPKRQNVTVYRFHTRKPPWERLGKFKHGVETGNIFRVVLKPSEVHNLLWQHQHYGTL